MFVLEYHLEALVDFGWINAQLSPQITIFRAFLLLDAPEMKAMGKLVTQDFCFLLAETRTALPVLLSCASLSQQGQLCRCALLHQT